MKIEETFELAFQNHQKNNFKIAEKLYKQILKKQSDHFKSIFYLGTLSIQTKNFDKAKSCCEKAIQINPNYPEAYHNLGTILQNLGDIEKAIDCYEKAIQIFPNYTSAHNNLGNAFNELGEHKKAVDYCEKAIKINYNYTSAHNNLGNAFSKLGEYKKAVDCYKKAIKINPNYLLAHNNLGIVFRELGKWHDAIKFFQKANFTSSRAELLECTYFSNNLKTYTRILEKLTKQDPLNLRVATIAAYVSKKENIKNIYPFCKDPLNYVFIKNFKNELTSVNKFSKNLLKILGKIQSIWEPSSKTTKGGYQSLGNLFDSKDSEILKLKKIIEKQIINYRKVYKGSQDFFIKKWPTESKFRGWYVRLTKQGHQKSHIHPAGWLSGVIYLKVPKLLNKNEGSIEFTLHGYDYPYDKSLPNLIYSPKIFDITLFPSSLFHRTIPFNSQEERQVIAFDLVPKQSI